MNRAEGKRISWPIVQIFLVLIYVFLAGCNHNFISPSEEQTSKFSISPSPVPIYLHGSGGTANPPTLSINSIAPTATTAKYKDSPGIRFSGGNQWTMVGIWEAEPTLVVGDLTSLGDFTIWLGLKNSDDIGTKFDLRVDVLKGDSVVASGEIHCIQGVARNPSLAKEVTFSFEPFPSVDFDGITDVFSLKVMTRIGTTENGEFAGGHANATGLRVYFDAANRAARASVSVALLPIPLVTIAASGDSFLMGDATGVGRAILTEQTISYDYKLSMYEITNAQFAEFIADDGYSTRIYWTANGWARKQSEGWTKPRAWDNTLFNGAVQPVVGVSWYEAVAFCNWRSVEEGLTQAYDDEGRATLCASGYRLPTEVEWEYAAAKGASGETERLYAYGSTWDGSKVVCSVPPASASQSAAVGSKSPAGDTPQGLCDMSGNAWEWCSDNYQLDEYLTPGTDRYYFVNDIASQYFVWKGGAWYGESDDQVQCANYTYTIPADRGGATGYGGDNGFRVCRP